MEIKIVLIFIQYLTFCYRYDFVNAEPMIGQNVRKLRENPFPFVVSLVQIYPQDNFRHICTGTLISRRDVALAGHCISGQSKSSARIVVGTIDYKGGRKYSVLWWLTYNQWASRNQRTTTFEENDVANIRLNENLGDQVSFVKFSELSTQSLYGKIATVVGWGAPDNTPVDPILKTADVKILSIKDCMKKVKKLGKKKVLLDERQSICTVAKPFVILNHGDAGGPLLVQNEMVGINTGNLPTNVQTTNPKLINHHVAIEFYKHFFIDVIQTRSK